MKYSIEMVDKGRARQAIVLRAQEDTWKPLSGQVEIDTSEASKHASLEKLGHWKRVEFEHDRLRLDYEALETLLVH